MLGNFRSVRDLALDATFGDYRLARALHPRFPWAGPGRVAIWATETCHGDEGAGFGDPKRRTTSPPVPASRAGGRPSATPCPFAGTLYGTEEVAG